MVYNIHKIVSDVRIAIDRNMTSGSLLKIEDIETLTLEDVIRSKIEDATRRVESTAPVHMLDSGHNFGDAVYWTGGGSGFVLLPDDFMRLMAFRMSDWERTAYEAISPDDPRYAMQSSRYGGIRGNPQKPVCAIVMRPEGRALEFYSSGTTDEQVVAGIYLPYPKIDADGMIEICERCYSATVYAVASLVLTTLGENDRAAALSALSREELQ